MAAPHVAGIVARLVQQGQSDVATIRGILRTSADMIGEAPKHSPSTAYTSDGEQEGVAQVPYRLLRNSGERLVL